jgi:hypothetical protein
VSLLGTVASAVALTACGSDSHQRAADALGTGYVQVGQLKYQVQISRELNAFSAEDSSYLDGLSAAQRALPYKTAEWYGVFIQVYNWTHQAHTPAGKLYITDTLGNRYTPLVNATPNPYTYRPAPIRAGGQLPASDSTAFFGPTQGEVLLFQIPYATLSNRPLVLHIVDPANAGAQSQIELDA